MSGGWDSMSKGPVVGEFNASYTGARNKNSPVEQFHLYTRKLWEINLQWQISSENVLSIKFQTADFILVIGEH